MSKYIKLYDAIMAMDEWFCEPITPTKILSDLPAIEVSEDFAKDTDVPINEDCISREWVLNKLTEYERDYPLNELDDWQNAVVKWITTDIVNAPSVAPSREDIHREKEQAYYLGYEDGSKAVLNKLTTEQSLMAEEWNWKSQDICDNCGYEIPHLKRVIGDTVLMDSKDWHYCPFCGAKMGGDE